MYCPGCGGTRAVEALLHFDIIESFMCNPLVLYLIFYIIAISISFIKERKIKQPRKYWYFRLMLNISVLIVIFLIYVVRNYLLIYKGVDVLGDFS